MNFFCILTCFLLSFYVQGQSLIRSSLSSFGGSISSNGFVLKHTVGQSSNTKLFNDDKGSVLRQGFQQPFQGFGNKSLSERNKCELTLINNTSNKKFTIRLGKDHTSSELFVFNSKGKFVFNKNFSGQEYQFNPIKLSSGIYIVKIKTSDNYTCDNKFIILK